MPEPVTLEEARAHLRVLHTDEDTLITSLIIAAREWVENATGLVLVERTVTDRPRSLDRCGFVELARRPVLAGADLVFSYIDTGGEVEEISTYRLLESSLESPVLPARLLPALGDYWPATYPTHGAVSIAYTAGYATVDDVPQLLKRLMLVLVQIKFERRTANDEETRFLRDIVGKYRLVRV